MAGNDRLSGGPDTDTADYTDRWSPVRVELDNLADDGAFSEGDNVHSDVENVNGGQTDDQLLGDRRANRLRGNGGDELLSGGAGADTLAGGDGNDTLSAVDGVSHNDTVRGGVGLDTCTADPGDTKIGCER